MELIVLYWLYGSMMVRNMIGLIGRKGAFHERKHRLIPVLIFAFILTGSCARLPYHVGTCCIRKAVPIILPSWEVGFSDLQELVLQEISQILKAGNDSIITYSPRYKSCRQNQGFFGITPPTAIPAACQHTDRQNGNSFFSGGYQLYAGR